MAATVLVTDGQQRKSLAAVRALGRAGHRVLVCDETRLSLSRASRHCARGLVCPPPHEPDRWYGWLQRVVAQEGVDVVMPMDDLTTEALVARGGAPGPARTLVPDPDAFGACRDKLRTVAAARAAGVDAPAAVGVESVRDLDDARRAVGPDAVVRPRRGAGGRGLAVLGEIGPTGRDLSGCMVQRRVAVERKFDVGLLYDDVGRLRASFVQEELRWFPSPSAASILQESVARPDLVERADRLIRAIGWRGACEVEFVDGADGLMLMEVNPRFWASVALAIRCGVDFPRLWVDLAMGKDVRGPASYPEGVRCVWSLPGDLLHRTLRRAERRRDRVRLGHKPAFDDIVCAADPWPALMFFAAAARYALSPAMWRMLFRW